ncbi:hypothetical protein [Methylorubrum extorquens]|jgi:hypothetical protein|uniref:hypothetical protein n=1 Tax=Methylorubrum extorquens TaxID=408 RepID=UPI001EE515BE|nr:hypothetical protein [Methylorubrum extorquens]MCG5248248.1 hypothetical protein [Methylorubrum extorquens]
MPVHTDGERRSTPDGATALCRLWRTVGPGALTSDLVEPLLVAATAALASTEPGRAAPSWDDGPAAIREARASLERWGPTHPRIDVAATVALAVALRGDVSAATFLADALDRLAAGDGGPYHARFAREWRARADVETSVAATGES